LWRRKKSKKIGFCLFGVQKKKTKGLRPSKKRSLPTGLDEKKSEIRDIT